MDRFAAFWVRRWGWGGWGRVRNWQFLLSPPVCGPSPSLGRTGGVRGRVFLLFLGGSLRSHIYHPHREGASISSRRCLKLLTHSPRSACVCVSTCVCMQACLVVFLGDFEGVILGFFFCFFVGLGTYFCYKCCNTVTSLWLEDDEELSDGDRTEPCRW